VLLLLWKSMMRRFIVLILISASLLACNSQPKKADGTPLRISDVKAKPEVYKGKSIRWAGNIVSVVNYSTNTVIEVLGKRLDAFGNANDAGVEQGRFYAVFPGFKDPAQYAKGRLLLVEGSIRGVKTGKIGAHRYVYPEVLVKSHKLSDHRWPYGNYGPAWHWGIGWGWGRHGGHGGHIGVGWGY